MGQEVKNTKQEVKTSQQEVNHRGASLPLTAFPSGTSSSRAVAAPLPCWWAWRCSSPSRAPRRRRPHQV